MGGINETVSLVDTMRGKVQDVSAPSLYMNIAVTGGTGFIGRHLASRLLADGHVVHSLSTGNTPIPATLQAYPSFHSWEGNVSDQTTLDSLISSVDTVFHLAGINHERGAKTFDRVHVHGTRQIVAAAEAASIDRIILTSYLRARPDCGSRYHETKWHAEELCRESTIPSCIVKPAAVYGPEDQFVTGLSRWLRTFPIIPTVGLREPPLAPVAVDDVVDVLIKFLQWDTDTTVALTGPTSLTMRKIVRIILTALNQRGVGIPAPVFFHRLSAPVLQRLFSPPLVTPAGVTMLAEGMVEPAPADVCDALPEGLEPTRPFDVQSVKAIASATERYALNDMQKPW